MPSSLRRDFFTAVQPVAKANITVNAVVHRLASNADKVQDPELRALILNAAAELLDASKQINSALTKVAEAG